MKETHIFAEDFDPKAMEQFTSAMDEPFALKGALMPDVHFGYSLPIGAVVATGGVVVPAWVGYDIGCGMCAVPTTFGADDVKVNDVEIFGAIYEAVPVGFNHNETRGEWEEGGRLPATPFLREQYENKGLYQIGTLGGGNHFIEIGADEAGTVWIITHSGSRNLGHRTATHYIKQAHPDGKCKEGHYGFDVDSVEGVSYITDLQFCLQFALANRREIVRRVEDEIAYYMPGYALWDNLINRNHNHAEFKEGVGWIHRKGATHAEAGMMGVIPGNMRDGSFIVRGKGNPDALWSSSHGAGRVLGRKEAKRVLYVADFEATMQGVTAKVDADTLDESPEAYKSIHDVMALQADLVDVLHHVKPIINIKG